VGLIQALVLGIIQGLTEFLPISSSGHLVLVPAALGWESPPLVFDATIHLATLIAVIAIFWHDITQILAAWWQGLQRKRPLERAESRLGWWIILGTIPGVLAGLLWKNAFESFFNNPQAVGGFLLLTAGLLILADVFGKRQRGFTEITWLDSILIGIGQAIAIAPGVSRSGATIAVGIFCGLSREAAARFSFLLAIPIIIGAGLIQLIDLLRNGNVTAEVSVLVVGFVAAAICGYAAIRFLLAYLRKHSLYPFAIYCAVVGILAIIYL
jgi:undecaprenyl-diphosphatase